MHTMLGTFRIDYDQGRAALCHDRKIRLGESEAAVTALSQTYNPAGSTRWLTSRSDGISIPSSDV